MSPAAAAAAAASPEAEVASILLVDDRPENLLALEAILEPLHQRLVRAHSGDEALRYLLRNDVACILLDVQMPGLNGFETAQIVKSRERSRYIPIIFLTAISKEEAYVFRGYEVGAVDYMAKPFQPDILRSKVAVFVDLWQKQRQLARQEQLLRESQRRELELEHVAELRASEVRLSEVVDAAMDAIVMFDGDGNVTLFNSAAERMFGVGVGDVLGRSVGELFPEDVREAQLERVLPGGARRSADDAPRPTSGQRLESLVGCRTGGESFPIEATISCVTVAGEPLCTMIARDITERRRAEEALKTQAESLANSAAELKSLNEELSKRQEELERAMAARSRFYASMSHELRTPINAILGYNTLLLERIYGELNDRQAQGLERTQKAAKHLLELVNDVLDLSKIEAGKMELSLQPVRFPQLVEELFVTVRPMADEAGSSLSLEHEGDAVTVTTDPRRVRQILLNLLSNAIKFGEQKPIRVRSHALPDGGIEIAVEDHGVGIAAEDLPRIFDEFVQLQKGPSAQEGTGLGLPISRRLASLLRGHLVADSAPGKGSTFTLVLPASGDVRDGSGPTQNGAADAPNVAGGGLAAPDRPLARASEAPDSGREAFAPGRA